MGNQNKKFKSFIKRQAQKKAITPNIQPKTSTQQIKESKQIIQKPKIKIKGDPRAILLSKINAKVEKEQKSFILQKWQEMGKNLDQIDGFSTYNQNLKIIPAQINIFKQIKQLGLVHNNIIKISNLDMLINLQDLRLGENAISQIENLDKLTNLKNLDLQQNQISKIKGLENLLLLERLHIRSNKIEIVENLEHLLKLNTLFISFNPLKITEESVAMLKTMKEKQLKLLDLPIEWIT